MRSRGETYFSRWILLKGILSTGNLAYQGKILRAINTISSSTRRFASASFSSRLRSFLLLLGYDKVERVIIGSDRRNWLDKSGIFGKITNRAAARWRGWWWTRIGFSFILIALLFNPFVEFRVNLKRFHVRINV